MLTKIKRKPDKKKTAYPNYDVCASAEDTQTTGHFHTNICLWVVKLRGARWFQQNLLWLEALKFQIKPLVYALNIKDT